MQLIDAGNVIRGILLREGCDNTTTERCARRIDEVLAKIDYMRNTTSPVVISGPSELLERLSRECRIVSDHAGVLLIPHELNSDVDTVVLARRIVEALK